MKAKLRTATPYRRGPFVLRVLRDDGPWRLAVTVPARVVAAATERNALKRKLVGVFERLSLRAGWSGTLSVQWWSPDTAHQAPELIRMLCAESGILNQ